ncbi:hypothetical protein SNEBB_004026 [Seison nebaliae]|nr:hypothetical protein SNEBB_004026 [Seison nebaliae]
MHLRKQIQNSIKDASNTMRKRFNLIERSIDWFNNRKGEECDIVIIWNKNEPIENLLWLSYRLQFHSDDMKDNTGLLIGIKEHEMTRALCLYCTATEEAFEKGRKLLNIQSDRDLTSGERQEIVMMLLNEMKNDSEEDWKLSELVTIKRHQKIIGKLRRKKAITGIFPLHNMEELKLIGHEWIHSSLWDVPLDHLNSYYGNSIALYYDWLSYLVKWLSGPAVCGVILYLYTNYILGVSLPKMYSLLLQTDQEEIDREKIENFCLSYVFYSIFLVFWCIVHQRLWRRREWDHAINWGTIDMKEKLLQDARPEYYGIAERSEITGEIELVYPRWKRHIFRLFVSIPSTIILLLFLFYIQISMQTLVHKTNEESNSLIGSLIKMIGSQITKLILGSLISFGNRIYRNLAYWLNKKENYREQSTYDNQLTIKLLLFYSLNSYTSLFYTFFYLNDYQLLYEQISALLIYQPLVDNFNEAILPLIKWNAKHYQRQMMEKAKDHLKSMTKNIKKEIFHFSSSSSHSSSTTDLSKNADSITIDVMLDRCRSHFNSIETLNRDVDSEEFEKFLVQFYIEDEQLHLTEKSKNDEPSQVEIEMQMKESKDILYDFIQMYIRYGHICLFGAFYPLTCFFAFLHNIVELRSDGFKMSFSFRRPLCKRANSIGEWNSAFSLLSYISICHCLILIYRCGIAKNLLTNYSLYNLILLLVYSEKILFLLKYLFERTIGIVPYRVKVLLAKREYERKQQYFLLNQ